MAARKKPADSGLKIGEYVILRGYRSGVHAGVYGGEANGRITLIDDRRIWRWYGAGSLSELAVYGPNPTATGSRIGAKIPRNYIDATDVSEIIVCCDAGARWLSEAPEWRA